MPAAEFRPLRATACDELIAAVGHLAHAEPPIDLDSHPETARLLSEPSPLDDTAYKHREDLLDAVICAWTGLLWLKSGTSRCQVLGSDGPPPAGMRRATVIAPCRDVQRRPGIGDRGPAT